MALNNFQYFDPNLTNALSDSAYTSNTQRQNGVQVGDIFPSPLANKLFFQVACMSASLALMMQNKGYDMLDTNGANLAASLANILTNHDIAGNLVRFADFTGNLVQNGWVQFPNGLILNWGLSNAVAGDANSDTTQVTLNKPFPTAFFAAVATANSVSPGSHGGTVVHCVMNDFSAPYTTFNITMVNADSNNHVGAVKAYWFAVGN